MWSTDNVQVDKGKEKRDPHFAVIFYSKWQRAKFCFNSCCGWLITRTIFPQAPAKETRKQILATTSKWVPDRLDYLRTRVNEWLMNVKQSARNSFAPPTEANVAPTTKTFECGGTLLAKKKTGINIPTAMKYKFIIVCQNQEPIDYITGKILLCLDNNSEACQIHPSAYRPNSAHQRAHSDCPIVLETYVQSSRNDQPMYHVSRKCWST